MKSPLDIHLLAASLASGSLLSMTAPRAAARGGREAIIDKREIRLADNVRRAMNGEV
jgi:hypothetical protein